MTTQQKNKTSKEIFAELEKKNGLSRTGEGDLDVVPSGSYTIDRATYLGGYPLGKVIEIFGPESSGKSTIVLHAIKSFIDHVPTKTVTLFDYEHSWDKRYGKAIGIPVDDETKFKVYQPDDQEQGYDMIVDLVKNELCSLIVLDSHTAAIPKKIIEGDIGDATMASSARNNSKFLGNIKGILDRTNTTLIGVSQTRQEIGSMSGGGEKPTGGNSWKFYSDMRLKIWKSPDKDKELNKTTLDVIKNKCQKPFGKAEFNILWGEGVDIYNEIIDIAEEQDIIKRSGSWYSYGDMKLGQGAEKVKELFKSNNELYKEIKIKALGKDY